MVKAASRRAGGFTYIGLLIVVAIVGLGAAMSLSLGVMAQRRQVEDELLFTGLQYKRAIRSYFEATPPGMTATPPARLEDLLRDPRYPSPRRHLRRLYPDPVTGQADWALIRSMDGRGILGVRSRSTDAPLRVDHFPEEFFHFKGRKRYADWLFVYGVVCSDTGCEIDPAQNAN
ncbi:MAG: type II secretion system protein [Candidatus Dactylopiibacterium sp.]|nr:type II secretion system protein [Candidatus Dactylopiibacterium sp.]